MPILLHVQGEASGPFWAGLAVLKECFEDLRIDQDFADSSVPGYLNIRIRNSASAHKASNVVIERPSAEREVILSSGADTRSLTHEVVHIYRGDSCIRPLRPLTKTRLLLGSKTNTEDDQAFDMIMENFHHIFVDLLLVDPEVCWRRYNSFKLVGLAGLIALARWYQGKWNLSAMTKNYLT